MNAPTPRPRIGFDADARLARWADRTKLALFALPRRDLSALEVLYVAPAFAESLGLTRDSIAADPERLLGRALDSGREEFQQLLASVSRGGNVEWQGRFDTPVGVKQIEWVAIADADSEGWHGWVRNTTHEVRYLAEREALLNRQMLAQGAAGFGIGFWEVHVATGETRWSQGQRTLFGLDPDDPVPSLDRFAHGISRSMGRRVETALDAARETGEAFEIELRLAEAEKTRYVMLRGRGIRGESGAVEWVTGSSFDVTRQREAERAARESEERFLQAQKMEAVGRLAGGVAHDFNNLLTAIRGFTELAIGSLPDTSTAISDLQEVIESTRRAQQLTRKLVTIGRKQVVQRVPLDVNRIVAEMEPLLRRSLAEDIDFLLELGPIDASVRGDAGSLEQVVLNLAINARDAMPSGGRLRISTRAVGTDELAIEAPSPADQFAVIAVADSGCGIGEPEMAHIFEPFFTTKPTGKGSGLGLATVYNIVDDMQGGIHVDSAPGRGTTMSIVLPLTREAAPARRSAPAEKHRKGTETILVVEDDHRVRRFTTRSLEKLGYRIVQAENGSAAMAIIRSEASIDLLFTDVVMPGMSGTEVARQAIAERSDLRVLFTTGFTQDRMILHGLDLGSDGVLLKPFTLAQLSKTVREHLDAPATETAVRLFESPESDG